MQITEICNPSAQRDAVGSAYIRQQVSDKAVGSVPAATMAGYQDLSNFERGFIVGAREMGHSISELYASPGPANAAIELLMTGNKLPGVTSLVSNCIRWMDMYWHGDNLMNPWTQHVNRELFNLVEPLWWYGAFAVGLIWDL
ncbi:hypothetical protein AVEN_174600-1 [Araneus ventricosus]|uniref:Uncharacterized protein n=1 Tax=Araneus ventricosus TaxID=182803 RepID=A0A4Y2SIY0_ARAVE|nr:hypothetical protein AVEN_174600-1 [Araneus ventricosus]